MRRARVAKRQIWQIRVLETRVRIPFGVIIICGYHFCKNFLLMETRVRVPNRAMKKSCGARRNIYTADGRENEKNGRDEGLKTRL